MRMGHLPRGLYACFITPSCKFGVHPLNCCRAEVVDYYMLRCRGNYQMLEKLNVIGRTSEFARLYGIEFENVLTRGSQVY